MTQARAWQWPDTGPTPVNYGLDTEIFDSEKFPHVQTFVREAIQNSLDARSDRSKPVRVRFAFHSGRIGPRGKFLSDLTEKKTASRLAWPEEWTQDKISWLVVEDSNSTGLNGALSQRTSDFWNYWLNFGISNKDGAGRGGRGIGRVTFLIASGISTVIGVTRRASDGSVVACGMSLLKPVMVEEEFKSSYAYLAKGPSKSVYELYDDAQFIDDLTSAFEISDYAASAATGLSLIIPYPHHTLRRDAVIASAIEHFAPAIISQALVVEVDDMIVDAESVDDEANRVASEFPAGPLQDDPIRFLGLVRMSNGAPNFTISLPKANTPLTDALGAEKLEEIQSRFATDNQLTIEIEVPVVRAGKTSRSRLCAALARAPTGQRPIDLFFREGMCLPEVTARSPADVDLVLMSNDGELATYLNFCEGKAHLGLIENKDVSSKLRDNGFSDGYAPKRLVRSLPNELRRIALPDASKPDASIFSGFFSIPKHDIGKNKNSNGAGQRDKPSPVPPPGPIPPAQPRVFAVQELSDGFRLRANEHYTGWPMSLRLEIAYADGSRRPKWSKYDFEFRQLRVQHIGSEPEFNKNVVICRDCGPDFEIEIRGFDSRRELVTNVRPFRHA